MLIETWALPLSQTANHQPLGGVLNRRTIPANQALRLHVKPSNNVANITQKETEVSNISKPSG